MIRDDDLAWARTAARSPVRTQSSTLARLVLHVHEQDTDWKADEVGLALANSYQEGYSDGRMDAPLSPPPEAVEWAQKIGNRSRPGWWNEGVYEAAMFILTAAGKDTDDE